MTCEHELIVTDEYWMSEGSVEITMKCQKCREEFGGIIFLK